MAISNAPQSGDQPAVGKTPTDDVRARKRAAIGLEPQRPVSYTHLTLPTSDLV